MSDIEGSDAPLVKGFKGKEKEGEGQAKREGKVTVGAMCRRRLAVVLVRLKMAETVKMVSLRYRYAEHSLIVAKGRHVRRAGPCQGRSRHNQRSRLPRHQVSSSFLHLRLPS